MRFGVQGSNFVPVNIVIFVAIFLVYKAIDFTKHFNAPNGDAKTIVYFCMQTHTSMGFGDITPKTQLGRTLAMLHLAAVWFALASVTARM